MGEKICTHCGAPRADYFLKPQEPAAKKEREPGDQLALIRKLERENRELRRRAALECDLIDETHRLLLDVARARELANYRTASGVLSEIYKLWGIE